MRITEELKQAILASVDELGTIKKLSEVSGVRPNYISKYLNGSIKTIRPKNWSKLKPHIEDYLGGYPPVPETITDDMRWSFRFQVASEGGLESFCERWDLDPSWVKGIISGEICRIDKEKWLKTGHFFNFHEAIPEKDKLFTEESLENYRKAVQLKGIENDKQKKLWELGKLEGRKEISKEIELEKAQLEAEKAKIEAEKAKSDYEKRLLELEVRELKERLAKCEGDSPSREGGVQAAEAG